MKALFTAETFAANVATLSSAIIDGAKMATKINKTFRDFAAPAYGDLALQGQIAELFTGMRRELFVKRDKYCQTLSRTGRAGEVDTFKKSVINQLAYAAKCAGESMGAKLAWNKGRDCYQIEELKAKNEPAQATATGKDANSAEQSAAIVAAAEAAPVMADQTKAATAEGAILQLLEQGFSLADLEKAVHGLLLQTAAKETEAEAQAQAQKPKSRGKEKVEATAMAQAFEAAKKTA